MIGCFDSTVAAVIRLVNGSNFDDGRLEIYIDGIWESVCDIYFDQRDADVACRQLGYKTGSAEYFRSGGGTGRVWMKDLNCVGTEDNIIKCGFNILNGGSCIHDWDVGLRCNINNTEGDLRITDRINKESGRLEIYYNGTWGSICADNFDHISAIVACKQLGYNSTAATFYTAGNGFGNIWLDEVKCSSSDSVIFKCLHNGWGIHNCGHYRDVGIQCKGEQSVNGGWSLWSNWTECSVSCGGGIQQRLRTCTNPAQHGFGALCDGSDVIYMPCNSYCCPNIFNAYCDAVGRRKVKSLYFYRLPVYSSGVTL